MARGGAVVRPCRMSWASFNGPQHVELANARGTQLVSAGASLNVSVKQLTASIAGGDREAFTQFYRDGFDPMFVEARRVTKRDESFCLDVVQDAMLRVIRSLRPVETEAQLAAWLKVVVRASAYDRLRGELHRRRREQASPGREDDRNTHVELTDRLEWLRREIADMDGPNMRLFVMRYRLGWTLDRIGSALGLTPGAVDGRIGRAVAGLKKRAGETFDE